MNYKMLTAAALLGAIVGTTSLAQLRMSINNAKLDSTLYLKVWTTTTGENPPEFDDLPWVTLTPKTPYEKVFSKPFDFFIIIATDKVAEVGLDDHITAKKAVVFGADTFNQNLMIKAFYASPKQGMIVQALEKYKGKPVRNNISQTTLKSLIEAGEKTVEIEEEETQPIPPQPTPPKITINLIFEPVPKSVGEAFYASSVDQKWKPFPSKTDRIESERTALIAFTVDESLDFPKSAPITETGAKALWARRFTENKNLTVEAKKPTLGYKQFKVTDTNTQEIVK